MAERHSLCHEFDRIDSGDLKNRLESSLLGTASFWLWHILGLSLSTFIHTFTLPSPPSSTRVTLRHQQRRVAVKGLFPGAKVMRGRNWRWGDQDGKELLEVYACM